MTDLRALKKFLEPEPITFESINFFFRRPLVRDRVKIENYAEEDNSSQWLQRMLTGAVQYGIAGEDGEPCLTEDEAFAFVEAVGGIGNPVVDRCIELCGQSFALRVNKANDVIHEIYEKIKAGEPIEKADRDKDAAQPENQEDPLD